MPHRFNKESLYAVRAVCELALHYGRNPVSCAAIAEEQAIPRRFLELILVRLREEGILTSRRGTNGGYVLTVDPADLSIGRILRLFEGRLAPVHCTACGGTEYCELQNRCRFARLWRRSKQAVSYIYDTTTFADLLAEEPISVESASLV
jgi:Rrf2 family protein